MQRFQLGFSDKKPGLHFENAGGDTIEAAQCDGTGCHATMFDMVMDLATLALGQIIKHRCYGMGKAVVSGVIFRNGNNREQIEHKEQSDEYAHAPCHCICLN